MYLDESTTGLNSFTATSVIKKMLGYLAHKQNYRMYGSAVELPLRMQKHEGSIDYLK